MNNQISVSAPQVSDWLPSFSNRKFQSEAWANGTHASQQTDDGLEAFEERDRDDADLMAQRMEPETR
jgi:hypothetical protein